MNEVEDYRRLGFATPEEIEGTAKLKVHTDDDFSIRSARAHRSGCEYQVYEPTGPVACGRDVVFLLRAEFWHGPSARTDRYAWKVTCGWHTSNAHKDLLREPDLKVIETRHIGAVGPVEEGR